MPHTIIEYIPDHVAYLLVYGDAQLEEIEAANADGMRRVENSPHLRHFIADFRYVKSFPKNPVAAISTMKLFSHPNHGWQFFITDNPMLKFFSTLVMQAAKGSKGRDFVHITSDPEDVRMRLAKLLPQLGELPPMPNPQTYMNPVQE